MPLPYATLNLRRNPFGCPADEELAELLVIDNFEAMVERLERALKPDGERVVMQFMGECGRGKSSHLRALKGRFPGAPLLHFKDGALRARLPSLSRTPLMFLDETQRLGRLTRWRLFHSPASLVLGTHTDHRQDASARHLFIHHHEVGGLTQERLLELLERRIMWARLDPALKPGVSVSAALLDELLEQFGDDLRACLALLYELVQRMRAPGPIPLPSKTPGLPDIPPSRHAVDMQEREIHLETRSHLFEPLPTA